MVVIPLSKSNVDVFLHLGLFVQQDQLNATIVFRYLFVSQLELVVFDEVQVVQTLDCW